MLLRWSLHMQNIIREMHDLIETITRWYEHMEMLATLRLIYWLDRGSKIAKLYAMNGKVKVIQKKSDDDTEINNRKY